MGAEIPLFVELRGCINCSVSKLFRETRGKDYGFDHELVVACIVCGCFDYGHAIYNPFFDPEELIKEARKSNNPEHIKISKKYILLVKEKFGKFYEKIGVNLENLLED